MEHTTFGMLLNVAKKVVFFNLIPPVDIKNNTKNLFINLKYL